MGASIGKARGWLAAAVLTGALALGLAGCAQAPSGGEGSPTGGGASAASTANTTQASAYHKITAEEGKALIDEGGVTVVDVRTPQEYAEAHVPGAINIPNEDIGTAQPAELGNLDEPLVVYCRTGVRSKQASDKLVAMGFTNVNDMGGIVDWTYDKVSGTEPGGNHD